MRKLIALLLVCLLAAPAALAEFTFSDVDAEEGAPVEDSSSEIAQTAEADFAFGGADAVSTHPPMDDSWPRTIVVTVGGDTTLGSTEPQKTQADGFSAVVEARGYAWPFSGLVALFSQDDLTLVNFEGALTESTDKIEKLFNFKGPAEYAQMLTLGSVEAVTLANNHFGDYGEQGKEDTKATLSAYGITYCGPGEPAIYEVRGVKIGLIGNTFPYQDGKRDISKAVQTLRDEGCQIVIASFHWGSEYEYAFTRDQRNIGRAALRSGADVVVGHHPHVVQGIEKYEDRYILYSLGNLVFGGNTDPTDRDAYVARLTFTVHEDGSVDGPDLQIVPIRLTELEKGTDYRPIVAAENHYDRILNKILSRSSEMKGFENPR